MGLFDDLSRAASSVVTNVSRAGSSAINTASRTASGAISGASSTISNTFSSAGKGISSIASGASQAINSATKNTTSSLSGLLSSALGQVDQATKQVSTAVNMASEAASKATAELSSIDNLTLQSQLSGGILGTTYSLVSGASDSITAAQKAVDGILSAGGSVSASVYSQIANARKQVASVQRQIKTATDTTAKSILSAADSAASGKINLAGLATGLTFLNPVTAPLGIASVASTVGNSIASALTGGQNSTPKNSGNSGSTNWFNRDYGNPDVEFTDLKTGESRGYLGQFASPYAADENFLWFNTGKGNEQVPPGYSGWTDTPDAKQLAGYGLSDQVQYSSRELTPWERERVTKVFDNHGWLPEKKISSLGPLTNSGPSILNDSSSVLSEPKPDGIFGGISSALSGLFSGGNEATSPGTSSGNILDTVVETRDNMVISGAVDVISGDDVAGGAVTAGSAMAVDVLAPLDLMNAVNKVATGRGDELTAEDWGWAALDGGLLALGAFTGGLGYVGGKGLKTALKTGKNTVKIVDATGDAAKTLGSISEATKATEGVGEMANYGKYGKEINTALKISGKTADIDKTLIKQSDNIASSGKTVDEITGLKTLNTGTDALKTTKTTSVLKNLKTGLVGGALGVTGMSVYSALTGGSEDSGTEDTPTGQITTDQITGENPPGAATTEYQGYLQNQIDEIVSFLNDAFGGSSTAGTSTGTGSGGYGAGSSGGVVDNALTAVESVPVVGDIIKTLADRGLLVPVLVGCVLLAGVAYYFTSSEKTSGSKPPTRKKTKKRGAAA